MKIKKLISVLLSVVLILLTLTADIVLAVEETDFLEGQAAGPIEDEAVYTLSEQESRPVIMGYSVSRTTITKGSLVTIKVSIKHLGLTAEMIGSKDNLDINRLVDSFSGGREPVSGSGISVSGGDISVEITSEPQDILTYDITFSNLRYSGQGNIFRFMCGYKNIADSFVAMELTIAEVKEYDSSVTEPEPDIPDPEPAPVILISRAETETPILPGQETDIIVTFKNVDKKEITSAVATFTPSDSLMIVGGSSSVLLNSIPGRQSHSIVLRVKVADSTSSEAQSLGVELKFNYYNNQQTVQGSCTDRLTIPVVIKSEEKHSEPQIIVTRSALKPVSANETFKVTLNLKNAGDVAVKNMVVSVSTADSLVLQNEFSTFVFDLVEAGNSASIPLKLKSAKELTSSTQEINLDIKFSYDSGGEVIKGNVSERVTFASYITEAYTADSSVPNIVVSDYTYGEDAVLAGGKFPLKFSLENTGKIPVENIVVTIDGVDSFAIDGGTNTFHYDSIDSLKKEELAVNMQALAVAKTGAQTISISCKYEYMDGNKRSSAATDIKLSVPVFQPDRFKINAPSIPEMVYVGEEVFLSLSYVNKGKAEVGNVEAIIEGDVESPSKTQYLGNFEPGKSGNISFIFTPQMPGEVNVNLKINYEDANLQVHTIEFPLTLNVEEMQYDIWYPEDDYYYQEEVPENDNRLPVIGAGVVLTAVVIIIIISVVKKKKKRKAAAEYDAGWLDEWPDDEKKSDM